MGAIEMKTSRLGGDGGFDAKAIIRTLEDDTRLTFKPWGTWFDRNVGKPTEEAVIQLLIETFGATKLVTLHIQVDVENNHLAFECYNGSKTDKWGYIPNEEIDPYVKMLSIEEFETLAIASVARSKWIAARVAERANAPGSTGNFTG